MKNRYLSLSICMIVFIIGGLTLGACRPKDPTDDDAYTLASPPAGPYTVISPMATYFIHPGLIDFRFHYVDPGWFPLGTDGEDDPFSRGDETPAADTHLPGYWMSEGEVTNGEYAQCVEAGVCSLPTMRETGPTIHYGDPSYDNYPVVGVDWYQGEGYCQWILARLPSEAEWEKAAGGETSNIYPWGNDEPTCDRANAQLPGCEDGGETKPAGSYPLGASPYGFLDMAGNVREWTADWYAPDAYLTAAAYMPTGPKEGEKKVVRGGGFNDFKENLRTSARWAYPPADDFDDVGFRCIPVTPSYAPICEPSFVPLCYDPRIPKDDEPCEPGTGTPGEEGVTLLGFGCPMNKKVCFEVSTNGGGNNGYSAMVDADGFTCGPLDERPDIIQCCGSEQPMGRNVEITICAPGGSPEGEPVVTTAMQPSTGIAFASLNLTGAVSLMRTASPKCPDGYTYDPASGECLLDETKDPCPENWTFDTMTGACMPNESEEDCPPGTNFAANLRGCEPDDGECPKGFFLTDAGVCEPDENNGDDCPPGYYFNREINCCEPIPADNYDCPEGYYWHEKYEKCMQLDDNNCPPGTTYDGYGRCGQQPFTPGPDDEPQSDCPPGMLMTTANHCDQSGDTSTPENPPQGTDLRTGDQIGPDGLVTPQLVPGTPQCLAGYYFDEKYERCMERDEDDCSRGYFFDTSLEKCVPTGGPNSPCPIGFSYNPRTECCVPDPNMDGTRCPRDPETPIGTPDLTQGFGLFQTSNFDPESGECEDDGRHGDGMPCPIGMLATAAGNCDQYPPDETLGTPDPEEPAELTQLRSLQCPEEYWNDETGECHPPEPCNEGEYLDPRLGYCIPLRDDCCPIGQDYAPGYEACVDVRTKPRNGECPNGYELLEDGLCWLIGRTEGQGGMCWTITRNTPRCIGPCEVGLIYNEATGRCDKPPESEPEPEQPTDPCANVSCTRNNCPQNCCYWTEYKECKKK